MEVAAAGEDDGEEASVAGEAEFTDGDAVEKDARGGLGDGDGLSRGVGNKGRNGEFREVGGFFFESALEIDARFIGGPLENAKADAEASDSVGSGEVANFEDFLVEIVGDFGAGGREGEAAGEGIKGGDLGGVLRGEFETLEARGTVEVAVALDGDGGIAAGDARGCEEGAAFKGFSGGAGGDIEIAQGEELAGGDLFGEVDEGGVIAEPQGIFSVHHKGFLAAGTQFVAGVVEEQKSAGLVGRAAVGIRRDGVELHGEDVAVGGPGEGFDEIGERLVAKSEFFAREEAAAMAAGAEEKDVVALQVVFFCFVDAADGEGNAAIGGVGEGGDIVVDVDEGLVEVLGASGGEGREEKERQRGEEEKGAQTLPRWGGAMRDPDKDGASQSEASSVTVVAEYFDWSEFH